MFQVDKYPQILHNFCRIKRRRGMMAPPLIYFDKVDEIRKKIINPVLCDTETRILKSLIIFINSIKKLLVERPHSASAICFVTLCK